MISKPVTIKDVADKACVSYQTVSKVINGKVQVSKETESRIWQAIEELGYRPSHTARSLRSKRTHTIGYSWPPTPQDQENPILDQFLQSMFLAAERGGYYLLAFPHHSEYGNLLDAYSELIVTGRVDGFILSSIDYDDPRINFLLERKFPFVAFGRSNPDLKFPYIDVDGGEGLAMAIHHLLEQGHQRIATLAWPETSRVGNNRLEGYFRALASAGISISNEWIARGEGSFSFGYSATCHWLDLPAGDRPTAIVALCDIMAIGAMQAARDRGIRVGTDLAITGFDNGPMAKYFTPPLTSLHQPVWEIGDRVINMLLTILEGKDPDPYCELLLPQLIIRESSIGWK